MAKEFNYYPKSHHAHPQNHHQKKWFDQIEFINGYNKDARRLITAYEGFTTRNNTYCIKIGRILK